jgi:hypothetical protein
VPWRVRIPGHAFAPMIVFIPCSGDGCKPGDYDTEWLPRRCPACRQISIIGHGRRRRQAHDRLRDWILVRRGVCKVCGSTLTVLPDGCVPGAQYGLQTRQEALERLGEGVPTEQAAPHCRDPNRSADPSTIRRWLWRRLESLPFLAWAPTLLSRYGRVTSLGWTGVWKLAVYSYFVRRRTAASLWCRPCRRLFFRSTYPRSCARVRGIELAPSGIDGLDGVRNRFGSVPGQAVQTIVLPRVRRGCRGHDPQTIMPAGARATDLYGPRFRLR